MFVFSVFNSTCKVYFLSLYSVSVLISPLPVFSYPIWFFLFYLHTSCFSILFLFHSIFYFCIFCFQVYKYYFLFCFRFNFFSSGFPFSLPVFLLYFLLAYTTMLPRFPFSVYNYIYESYSLSLSVSVFISHFRFF